MKNLKEKARFVQSRDVDFDYNIHDLLDHRDCLFYDIELKGLYKASKTLYDIMKVVHNRFVNRKTLNLAPSVAQYLELTYDSEHNPEVVFDFRFRLIRICITRYKGRYCVYSNFKQHSDLVNVYRQSWHENIFGCFDSVEDAFDLFSTAVSDFMEIVVKSGLF